MLNSSILIIILIFIPDISYFKAAGGFVDLYEQIPYFANMFRYAFISQNLGYLAIPISFYSRAQIFTFILVFIIYFFLVKKTLPLNFQRKTYSILKKVSFLMISLFLTITFVRFSAMDYYGDRIPEESIIKDPIVFSLFDYASQGYSNGLNQLENK